MAKFSHEQALVEGLLRRSEEAFTQLVQQYSTLIFRACYGVVRQREEAEDLTQEVMLEVLESISEYRGHSRLSTWLYRIAVNKSLNLLKRAEKRYLTHDSDFVWEQQGVMVHPSDPHRIAEQQEELQIIETALGKLPENQRIAFVLGKMEALPYKEVAEIMGISLSAVESLIHRAKQNLQKMLFSEFNTTG